jgi:phosphoribosylaminoimidazolecarboxamide formyltransferase/IMP cyclohydrolase
VQNHGDVFVVVEPADYSTLLEVLKKGGSPEEELAFKKKLAWKAYQHTSSYDSAVAEWLWGNIGGKASPENLKAKFTMQFRSGIGAFFWCVLFHLIWEDAIV